MHRRKRAWRHHVDGAMWPDVVVFFEPLLYDATRFGHRVKFPAVQTAITEEAVETFIMAVLLGTAWVNVMPVNMLYLEPVLYTLRQ